jgi:hypothetical protein
MNIQIRNFRGISAADFVHETITLIGAENHKGKTSAAEAVGAVLSGELKTRSDILKKDLKGLVRDGTKAGHCQINIGESVLKATWPDCEYSTEGPALNQISKLAAGTESFLEYKRQDRANILSQYIKSEPTAEDIRRELNSLDIPEKTIAQIIDKIKISDFDSVFGQVKEKGTKLKGNWEQVTGERYGIDKAKNWYPGPYYSALGARSEAELIQAINEAKTDVEAGIAAEALAGLELSEITRLAKLRPDIENYLKMLKGKIPLLEEKANEKQKELFIITQREQDFACPHCGGCINIDFQNKKLLPAEVLTEDQEKERARRAADLRTGLEKNRKEIRLLLDEIASKNLEFNQAVEAEERLKNIDAAQDWNKNLNECRIRLEKAETDLKAWRDYNEAKKINSNIEMTLVIYNFLSPAGYRQTKLLEALKPFNDLLDKIAKAADWPTVRIDQDYNIYFGERLVNFLSGSEIFKTKASFQIAIGILEKSLLIIIDGADIMVGKADRNGLIKALHSLKISALVFISLKDPAELPRLEGIGGRSYWINDGVLK